MDRAQAEPGVKSHKWLVGTSAARPLRPGHGPGPSCVHLRRVLKSRPWAAGDTSLSQRDQGGSTTVNALRKSGGAGVRGPGSGTG